MRYDSMKKEHFFDLKVDWVSERAFAHSQKVLLNKEGIVTTRLDEPHKGRVTVRFSHLVQKTLADFERILTK